MENLEDYVMLFHEPDCEGIITSRPNGQLICAECDEPVGRIEPAILSQLIQMLTKAPAR